MSPEMKRARQVLVELSAQKIVRAVYSDRQLEEVLTDFWFNHFNVYAGKGLTRVFITEYEREAIRPHVLGHFRDLLGATAKSPAMLFYLDNARSSRAGADMERRRGQGGRASRGGARSASGGINENYARELMELHTLGVDGGYTQQDVVNVARAFTGWTIAGPRKADAGRFVFNPRMHDTGEKVVLGHRIKAGGGIEDGEQVLDILASHPSTATFIATALSRRFVVDTPPPPLVERATAAFRQTGGDLRAVTRAILTSPEFFAPELYRAKVKTPFDFVVSALRATGADIRQPVPLERTMRELGMPLTLPAADRLQGHGRGVGEHRRAHQPHELRRCARRQHFPRRRRQRSAARSQPVGRRDRGGRVPERRCVHCDAGYHSAGYDSSASGGTCAWSA